MNLEKYLKWSLLVVGIALFFVVNSSLRPAKTAKEREFDGWLASQQQKILLSDSPQEALPRISVVLKRFDDRANSVSTWELESSRSRNQAERVLRVLQLAREGGVLDANAGAGDEKVQSAFLLEVREGEKSYRSVITRELAEKRLPVALLLRLFPEFSREATADAVVAKLSNDALRPVGEHEDGGSLLGTQSGAVRLGGADGDNAAPGKSLDADKLGAHGRGSGADSRAPRSADTVEKGSP